MPESAHTPAGGRAGAARIADPAYSAAGAQAATEATDTAYSAAGAPNASDTTADLASTAMPTGTAKPIVFVEGLLAALASFVVWGAFPFYLKPLYDVPSMQIIAHRVAWACVFVLVWLSVRGDVGSLRKLFSDRALVGRLAISALLITINWVAYVWGVGHGHVVETSLGYFISPLVNVLLGVVVLRERLNVMQWTSVGIAAAAVIYVSVATGALPWIALTIAASFSLYGFLRKIMHVEALQGLAVETLLLMPLASGYLIWCEAMGTGVLGHSSLAVDALLVGCGPMTAVPLFLFAFAARVIPYSTLGLMLYIAPSLQLLSGIFVYHEPFAGARALGFVLIWVALLIYAGDGIWRARRA
jgi:chloramphenicol-sensitive protein RarD